MTKKSWPRPNLKIQSRALCKLKNSENFFDLKFDINKKVGA